MAGTNHVNIIEVCHIAPSPDSPESATEFSLPLTFFDTLWFRFHPVERIFFYELTGSSPSFFNFVVLPKLKHSLSFTLLNFLPLAGKLVWPQEAAKPIILYAPNDAVTLTVAESNADFNSVSGKKSRKAFDSHPFIPHLHVSDSTASIIALQVTFFPNRGFCIGVSTHHAVLDGKSATMFIKAWAHICKQSEKEEHPRLLPELTPFFDRTVIQDPEGIDMEYLNNWLELKSPGLDSNPRSLKLLESIGDPTHLGDRVTFDLSREDIKKLREKVVSQLDIVPKQDPNETKSINLSTFVLTYAYMLVCIVKAKGLEASHRVHFGFSADLRARLDPPIPENYLGNCVSAYAIATEAEALVEENGVAFAAKRLSEVIKGLEKDALKGAKGKFREFKDMATVEGLAVGVAGSPKFGVYGSDFGWGRPKMVEITSIDRTVSISMAESRDGSGGVEVGVVLKEQEMEMFASLFANGLKDV